MIADFPDFCLWMYTIVDDIWQEICPLFECPGPEPVCSNSEVMAMSLIGECRGWDQETELLSHWREYPDLFPHIPERSRFNRRRRNLMQAFNCVRQVVLRTLDLAQDHQCVIDSLPVPVVQFHLVPASTGDWDTHGAAFGKVPTKKQTIYGYKLHLLIGLNGLILDFILAPANEADLTVGYELLEQYRDLDVIGDKGFVSASKQALLMEQHRVRLLTLPRRNQQQQVSDAVQHLLNSTRQIIETVNGQLTEQFNVERNHAHTFWGLCTRLQTKLAAHTLCIFLNRLLGDPAFLQIKKLAFVH
jgi:hypothetical protein